MVNLDETFLNISGYMFKENVLGTQDSQMTKKSGSALPFFMWFWQWYIAFLSLGFLSWIKIIPYTA